MVQGVLDRWIDVSKRRILEGWLAHVLHGGPVDAANGCFVPRVQISSLSKEVRDMWLERWVLVAMRSLVPVQP